MSYPGLGADFYGPPAPGQTDQEYQSQMSPAAVIGIGALAAINPLIGLAVGAAYLFSRPTPTYSKDRIPIVERRGGH